MLGHGAGENGTPVGLAHPALVRMWLKKRKTRFVKVRPGIVQLTCPHAETAFRRKWAAVRNVILGHDPGETAGTTLIVDHKIVWSAEAALKGATIVKRLEQRRGARSARRCRRKRAKGRAAKEARWRHRTQPNGWLAPSARHRVHGCLRWGRMVLACAEAGGAGVTVHVETTPFDTHKVLHPDVAGESYQLGPLYRTNLKGFVMTRDKRSCVYCGATTKLTLDHVVPRVRHGPNRHTNVVCACAKCNADKGNQDLEAWLATSRRRQVQARRRSTLERVRRIATGPLSRILATPDTKTDIDSDRVKVLRGVIGCRWEGIDIKAGTVLRVRTVSSGDATDAALDNPEIAMRVIASPSAGKAETGTVETILENHIHTLESLTNEARRRLDGLSGKSSPTDTDQATDQFMPIGGICRALCRATGRWGLWVSFHTDADVTGHEVTKTSAGLLAPVAYAQLFPDEDGLALFESESEMENTYNQIIGEDGPQRIYALRIGPDGSLLNNNT